jgi:hypothetical protein
LAFLPLFFSLKHVLMAALPEANEGKRKGLAITAADRVELSTEANEGKRKDWGTR